MALLGAHESVAGGLHLAFDRIRQVGGEVLQVFTRNQRQWRPAELTGQEIALFRAAHAESGGMPVASHASYLINLASSQEELWEKSITNLILELRRCRALAIPYVVLHPGAHCGDGAEAGLTRFVAGLDRALSESGAGVQVLVETTSGQGTGLGRSFTELAFILNNSKNRQLLGVCLDTCHLFAAGYELRTEEGYQATIAALEGAVGLAAVRLLHLNDSKKGLASRVDRHEHIGKGEIGLAGFANILNDRRFAGLPMVIETPKGRDLSEDRENLATLRSLIATPVIL